MPYFKNAKNDLFWLDDASSAEEWLLDDCVQISAVEAEKIRTDKANEAFESLTYAEKRIAEYPPITDYLDGVVKNDQAQIAKYISDCMAVKAKYPK